MAKKFLVTGSVLAAVLLAGCSGTNNGGNASASLTSPSSSTSTSISSSSSSSSVPASSSEEPADTSAADTASGAAAELDPTSAAWFTNMCNSFTAFGTDMDVIGSAQGTPQPTSIEDAQTTAVAGFKSVADGITQLAASIGSVPAPTVEGGADAATQLVTELNAAAASITAEADALGAETFADASALSAAAQASGQTITTTITSMQTSVLALRDALSPDVQAAVEAIPECALLGS